MSPRGQEQNEQMRAEALNKITMAALQVFSEYGYHGTTMKQIAQSTGLSYGLVYHYFKSKDVVFRHVVDVSIDQSIFAATQMLGAPGEAWEKIEQFTAFLIDEAVKGGAAAYFLLVLHAMTQGKSIPGFHDHVVKRIEEYYRLLAPLIAEAQKAGYAADGEPLVLAAAYFSCVQGLALLSVQGTGLERNIEPDMLLGVLRRRGTP